MDAVAGSVSITTTLEEGGKRGVRQTPQTDRPVDRHEVGQTAHCSMGETMKRDGGRSRTGEGRMTTVGREVGRARVTACSGEQIKAGVSIKRKTAERTTARSVRRCQILMTYGQSFRKMTLPISGEKGNEV